MKKRKNGSGKETTRASATPIEQSNTSSKSLIPPKLQLSCSGHPTHEKEETTGKTSTASTKAAETDGITTIGSTTTGIATAGPTEKGATTTGEKTTETAAKPAASGDSKFEPIEAILKQIPTGVEALALLKKYGTKVEFKAGGGSYFDSSKNSMVIDSSKSPEQAALTFVHEIYHTYYHEEGLVANAQTEKKEEYVSGAVREEAEGTVKSIEAKIELEGTKVNTKGLTFPLETQYRAVYDKIIKEGTKDGKPADEALIKTAKEKGLERVIKGFMDGEVVTSNTGASYAKYYGDYWDKVNPKK